jgi:hypothetical protein
MLSIYDYGFIHGAYGAKIEEETLGMDCGNGSVRIAFVGVLLLPGP